MSDELIGLNLRGSTVEGPSRGERGYAAGFAGAAVALVVSAAMWFVLGTAFVPLRVADALFAVLPISFVAFGVAFLGLWAKRFAFVGCIVGYAVILAVVGRLAARRWPNPGVREGVVLGLGVWAVASVTITPLIGGGIAGFGWGPRPVLSALSLLVTGVAFGVAQALAARAFAANEDVAVRAVRLTGRRTLFSGLVAMGVVVIVSEAIRSVADFAGIGSNARVTAGSGDFPDITGLSREVTPTADFYHVSKNVFDPEEPPLDWRLKVGGLVRNPLSLSMDEIRGRDAVEAFGTLMCIDNQVGGELIGNALWRGFSLASLLAEVGVTDGAVDVVVRAIDGYSDSIALAKALEPGTLLAYGMNEAPLNSTHGAPLRLVVPGIYGMKNVKWVTSIEIVATDFKGYWQRRGWDDTAEYQTMSRIDVARSAGVGMPATIAGIAFAGDRGVQKIEVSADGGKVWGTALSRPPLSPTSWVLWHYEWTPAKAGTYEVVVRATDGTGAMQASLRQSPVPRGATGLHSVTLRVS